MPEHEIEIEITADGTVKARIMGAKGAGCTAYADLLAKIVGRETGRELTAEYYEPGPPVQIKPLAENKVRR